MSYTYALPNPGGNAFMAEDPKPSNSNLRPTAFVFAILFWSLSLFGQGQDPLATADFFLGHYKTYVTLLAATHETSNAANTYEVPIWFKQLCHEEELNFPCDKTHLSNEEMDQLIKIYSESKYHSKVSGAIEIALKVARLDKPKAFSILKDIYEKFPNEVEFDNLESIRAEQNKWHTLQKNLPVIKTENFELNGVNFYLVHKSKGNQHALEIFNASGEIVFTDGPRWIRFAGQGARKSLSTSMTITFTNPKYRGSGLYQYAIRYYMNTYKVNKAELYSENEETLEFFYRFKQLIYIPELRQQLLEIPGIQKYLSDQGVNIDKFRSGHLTYLKMAEHLFGYLSLQGRTRLNLGLDFRQDPNEPAWVFSKKISPAEVTKIKTSVQNLEAEIETNIKSEHIQNLLPHSYLKKFRNKTTCEKLLAS